ncbi:MAG TPA: hypothetical protein VNT76_11895, partial [Candidatus Binatus sp.]|nr:hypothetical protein [Candidatus Binatus sp.]
MKRQVATALIALMLLAPLVLPKSSAAQQLELDRILNPMPEYDPFDKADGAPKFFPDEIDRRARELLIDALTNRPDALTNHLKSLQSEDDRRQKEH